MVKTKKSKQLPKKVLKFAVVLFAALLLYGLFQAYEAHQDIKTRKIANQKGQQLETYIEKNKITPASLTEAGVTDLPADTIYYTKRSGTSYSYCVKFRRNNDPTVGILQKILYLYWPRPDKLVHQSQWDSEKGTLVVDDLHLSGTECQNVSDYQITPRESWTDWPSYAKLPGTVCGVHYQASDTYHYGGTKNLSVDTDIISLSTAPGDTGDSPSYVNDPAMKIYGSNCSSISLSNLQPGDAIRIYTIKYPYPIGYEFDRIIAIKKL